MAFDFTQLPLRFPQVNIVNASIDPTYFNQYLSFGGAAGASGLFGKYFVHSGLNGVAVLSYIPYNNGFYDFVWQIDPTSPVAPVSQGSGYTQFVAGGAATSTTTVTSNPNTISPATAQSSTSTTGLTYQILPTSTGNPINPLQAVTSTVPLVQSNGLGTIWTGAASLFNIVAGAINGLIGGATIGTNAPLVTTNPGGFSSQPQSLFSGSGTQSSVSGQSNPPSSPTINFALPFGQATSTTTTTTSSQQNTATTGTGNINQNPGMSTTASTSATQPSNTGFDIITLGILAGGGYLAYKYL